MPVNISATFPKDERPRNGLEAIAAQLADEDLMHAQYLVVGTIRPKFYKANAEDGSRTPTVRFDHIEVMTDDRAEQARALLDEAYTERTGRDPQLALDFGVDGDGDRDEPTGEELLAERRERLAAEGGEA